MTCPRPILFCDLDGVLLRRRPGNFRVRDAFEIAPYSDFFLTWVVEHFDLRWLSTRCQSGDSQQACHAIRYALGLPELPAQWHFLKGIPATRWGSRKIDAIDLSADFYWVDDAHGEEALAILAANGKGDRAVYASVDRDPNALLHAVRRLAERRGLWRWE